jgi:uncharacterized protein
MFSQNQRPGAAAGSSSALPTNRLANTLLWKISGNGLPKPSYLFGTMHILCADDAKLSDSLKSVIQGSEEIFFEFNLDDVSSIIKSLKYMQMNNGQKLSDLLSTADFEKVKNYFDKHASPLLSFSMLERFKPMLISSLIEEDGLGCQTTDGMELVIIKLAHEQHKLIGGFETAQFQAGLFDSIPYETQAKELVDYVDSVDTYKKMTKQLADVYLQQDLTKIDELTRSSDPALDNYLDLLLYDRNRRWVNQLDTLMPKKSLLIAVGAGHLPGEKGVIQLLTEKGYTLTPLKN